jgi:electron transport complex protein RnfC
VFKLHSFHGGLILDGHKQHTARAPLVTADLPEVLIYPLLQRGGNYAKPIVAVGERVLKGQVIASTDLTGPNIVPIHAASSGIVSAIENRLVPHPSGLEDVCIVIKTDGQDELFRTGSPLKDCQSYSRDELLTLIQQAGIVGLGGAAFPTALKLNSPQHIDTLIINAVECEPYISCDDSLIQHHAAEIIQAITLLSKVLSASHCIIALEDDMLLAKASLLDLEGFKNLPGLELVSVPTLYPSGSEKQLIKLLTGKEVPLNGIPADLGIICLNVGTIFAIYQAIYQNQPLIERIITVTGDGVKNSQNLRVRMGTPIKDLIAQCGGYTDKAERLIMGGSMMGFALPDDEIPVSKATHCILVASRAELKAEPTPLPCIHCGECAAVCPMQLLPQQLYWHSRADNLAQAQAYHLSACIECGCCDVVCPSHIPLVHYFRAAKGKISLKQQQDEAATLAKQRYEIQQQRKQRLLEEQAEKARKQKQALEEMKAKLAAKKKP